MITVSDAQIVVSLTDDPRDSIYDCNILIIQVTNHTSWYQYKITFPFRPNYEHIFKFSFMIEGASEKVYKLYMPVFVTLNETSSYNLSFYNNWVDLQL